MCSKMKKKMDWCREAMTCWYVISKTGVYEFGSMVDKLGDEAGGFERYMLCLRTLLPHQLRMARLEVYSRVHHVHDAA